MNNVIAYSAYFVMLAYFLYAFEKSNYSGVMLLSFTLVPQNIFVEAASKVSASTIFPEAPDEYKAYFAKDMVLAQAKHIGNKLTYFIDIDATRGIRELMADISFSLIC